MRTQLFTKTFLSCFILLFLSGLNSHLFAGVIGVAKNKQGGCSGQCTPLKIEWVEMEFDNNYLHPDYLPVAKPGNLLRPYGASELDGGVITRHEITIDFNKPVNLNNFAFSESLKGTNSNTYRWGNIVHKELRNGGYSIFIEVDLRHIMVRNPSIDSDFQLTLGMYAAALTTDITFDYGVRGINGHREANVGHQNLLQPFEAKLHQSSDFINLKINLPSQGMLSGAVYNLVGTEVAPLFVGSIAKEGVHKKTVQISQLPAGLYFVKLLYADKPRILKFVVK